MILNDVRKDILKMLIDEDCSITELSRKIGDKNRQALNYSINALDLTNRLSPKVITALEALGYDIKIEYIERGGKKHGR